MIWYEQIYQVIKEEYETHDYSISVLCKLGKVSRTAYYKWINRSVLASEEKKQRIADEIEKNTYKKSGQRVA